ncbi:AMP-binding protein [Inmirania thermothiophila]|uniref:AMP-binding protein n=1 Tax=Inmirania thermothiophila TaxID=1750597 RepID=UPI001473E3DF|nr:AMP-binding protein [Inmirania thermothiophila]
MNAAEELLRPPLRDGAGGRAAIWFEGRTVSYAELHEGSLRFAALWRRHGVGRGDLVLFLGRDGPALYQAYLGAILAGAVPAALSLRMTEEELAPLLAGSGARLLVADADLLAGAAGRALPPGLPCMALDRPARGLPAAVEAARTTAPRPPEDMGEDDPAFAIFTSGTTGRPKCVVHAHRAVRAARRFMGEILGVGAGARVFCTSKLFFAYALGHALFATLAVRATAVLAAAWPEPEAVTEVVRAAAPEVVFSVPALYRSLLRAGLAEDPAWRRVRHCVAAGERLPEPVYRGWAAATGRAPVEGIGASETLFLFLAQRPGRTRPGVTGWPTPGTEVMLQGEDGAAAGAGRPGVLWVRMPSVALGYRGEPERGAAVLRDGWYCTGDMFVREEDGAFRYLGRADDMLKISGQWVSPEEIEAAAQAAPGVAEAAAVGVEDGDGLTRLALFVVPSGRVDDEAAFAAGLVAWMGARLARFKCPRRIGLLEALPRTATGKVRRALLRERAARMERERGWA